jgi:catechol 2,3-dioxygenase-like lactoylglutathione lyase family enzyme
MGAMHIEWSATQIDEHERAPRPRFSTFSHVSVAVHDLEIAKRFYTEVLGGRLVLEADAACEVILGGVIVGMSSRGGYAQPADAEYPHIGLNVEPEQFLPMKALNYTWK